ncbi:chloramphenicol-sensitive protein RarD [Formivibrio citricus]|uniref:Chloramphenicol-sensitive protein RarD n=1 Tax=Formivibrio citricus TaxID=83765 RepID=A0A1I4X7Q3_9NEIS|nr:EamA family transporter RarD [Formivibrio citricus]SFN21927.1 chloramphenicol-sensitive protein RarD [Formivibrio citricus]
MQSGILRALGAYLIWSLFPIYFKALQAIPPQEVLLHRMAWSVLFLFAILLVRRNWKWLWSALQDPTTLKTFSLSALLISANWYVYIWAVQENRVVDASLGYFINPLFNVLLGVFLLRERLRPVQWTAIALAAAGVLWLTVKAGQLPWIALSLAATFGTYGLIRKTAHLGAQEGLMVETALLFPFATALLAWLAATGQSGFVNEGWHYRSLLILAGPLTVIPLLLYASGARRIPYSLMGILQYVTPTVQFMLGVFLWHEPFNQTKLVGFSFIWLGLALYTAESLITSQLRKKPC